MKIRSAAGIPTLPEIECACATVRRAARLLTQLYDEELRESVQASQFALLSALEKRPGCNQAILSRALAFDKTTLSRNLSLMQKKGWIRVAAAEDRRERGFCLTAAGKKLLERAQNRLRSAMTSQQWDSMWQVLRYVTDAAYRAAIQKGDQ